ncbi:hypothetical protein [uncultured Neglectibacter sp.]|uniref:hypothetical protein n=1 Tax=uncultured Neglectibacter sp. TaxID=1924108 RepID=UPI0034DFDEDA
MIVQTYQSKIVLKILQSGETYRAKPNLTLKGEYQALIDLLGLRCECPVFGVVKGKRQNTGGKVSGSVKLTLDVPEKMVHLTEYGEWADFLYVFKYTKPGNYRSLRPDCEEITVRDYNLLLEKLKTQKPLSEYKCPQVVLEKIHPAWLKSAKVMGRGNLFTRLFRR